MRAGAPMPRRCWRMRGPPATGSVLQPQFQRLRQRPRSGIFLAQNLFVAPRLRVPASRQVPLPRFPPPHRAPRRARHRHRPPPLHRRHPARPRRRPRAVRDYSWIPPFRRRPVRLRHRPLPHRLRLPAPRCLRHRRPRSLLRLRRQRRLLRHWLLHLRHLRHRRCLQHPKLPLLRLSSILPRCRRRALRRRKRQNVPCVSRPWKAR